MTNLQALREARGWSREQLAGLAGLSAMTIHRLERGENEPNVRTVRALASVLGVSMDELFTEGDEPAAPVQAPHL